MSARRRLVLVGGGHTHALVLHYWAQQKPPEAELILVTPTEHAYYSGMLPGYVAGYYPIGALSIDLRYLVEKAGGRLLLATARGLDLNNRCLLLSGQEPLPFDVLSLNTGSSSELARVPGAASYALPLRPFGEFLRHWHSLLQQAQAGDVPRLVLAGAGAAGCELALAMRHRLPDQVQITLADGASLPLSGFPLRVRQQLLKTLQAKGIRLRLGSAATAVSAGALTLASGEHLPFAALFWATGAAAPAWLANTGLSLTSAGWVSVEATLQCSGQQAIFAAGDSAEIRGQVRPKAGVFAVREAWPLFINLCRSLRDEPLETVALPQTGLTILGTGDREAIAVRGPWHAKGAWVWRCKDWIDQRHMHKLQAPA